MLYVVCTMKSPNIDASANKQRHQQHNTSSKPSQFEWNRASYEAMTFVNNFFLVIIKNEK